MKGFEFVKKLVLEFKKIKSDDETKYTTFYTSSETEVIIDGSDLEDLFESIYSKIKSNIQKSLAKSPDWIIDSALDHTNNISQYKLLSGSSSIKLSKELDHPKKVSLTFKILMIINVLNGVWSNTYILQIII